MAPFCYPRRNCVKGKVLADLLHGERITAADTWRRHGSSRLAHHVLRLRQAGWPIITKIISATTSDGRTALIGEYRLPAKVISKAGEVGRAFAGIALRSAADA
jgi:hypothetical protein